MIKNICKHYVHETGRPFPESRYSCRGCKNSYDPNLYDAGCPDGPQPRDKKTAAEQRKVDELRKKIRNGGPVMVIPETAETR